MTILTAVLENNSYRTKGKTKCTMYSGKYNCRESRVITSQGARRISLTEDPSAHVCY